MHVNHPEYPNYLIYDNGKIFSVKRKIFLSPNWLDQDGYPRVNFLKEAKRKHFSIHRLVAEAFIPNPENKSQVNHKNGIKTDNRVENLEWVNNSENQLHAYTTGLKTAPHTKEIYQLDFKGNLVATYSDNRLAEKATGASYKNISAAALGKRRSAGGFIWTYIKPETNV